MNAKHDIRRLLFRYRSYTPLPVIILMLLFAQPSAASVLWGLPVAAAGEMIRLWGVSIAGSETRVTGAVGASQLVTSGPFAHVRNPLYLGNVMLYLGMGIASFALFPWLQAGAALWFVFQYSAIVSLEEEFLREKFGERYRLYAAAVPRFLPDGRTYRDPGGPQPELSWSRGLRSERRTLQAILLLTAALVVRGLV
ncbi:MAG TPA: isoprenylcysteine carboxylmethyltransferase family protein [Bacteroidota bacterium]|nr:isoprenylcysteine carboxylmethyltransferase family protein [Bacteroidota bacterium]